MDHVHVASPSLVLKEPCEIGPPSAPLKTDCNHVCTGQSPTKSRAAAQDSILTFSLDVQVCPSIRLAVRTNYKLEQHLLMPLHNVVFWQAAPWASNEVSPCGRWPQHVRPLCWMHGAQHSSGVCRPVSPSGNL